MVTTELVLTVLVANTTLYGFMVLYYTTISAVREQEKIWISVQQTGPARDAAGARHDGLPRLEECWVNALAATASANMFLLGCTLFAVPGVFLGVLSLLGFDALGPWVVVLFLGFVFVVAVGMVGSGIQLFRLNVREARAILGPNTPLMDVLNRGLGKR